jgi:hypothetical protein
MPRQLLKATATTSATAVVQQRGNKVKLNEKRN